MNASIAGSAQDQVGRGFKQHNLVKGVPADCRRGGSRRTLMLPANQTIPWFLHPQKYRSCCLMDIFPRTSYFAIYGNGICEKCITSCKNLLRIFVVNTYLRNLSENYLCFLLFEMSNAPMKKSRWTELCLQDSCSNREVARHCTACSNIIKKWYKTCIIHSWQDIWFTDSW